MNKLFHYSIEDIRTIAPMFTANAQHALTLTSLPYIQSFHTIHYYNKSSINLPSPPPYLPNTIFPLILERYLNLPPLLLPLNLINFPGQSLFRTGLSGCVLSTSLPFFFFRRDLMKFRYLINLRDFTNFLAQSLFRPFLLLLSKFCRRSMFSKCRNSEPWLQQVQCVGGKKLKRRRRYWRYGYGMVF